MAFSYGNFLLFALVLASITCFAQAKDNPESQEKVVKLDSDLDQSLNSNTSQHVKNFFLWTREYRDGKKFEYLDPANETLIKASHLNAGFTYVIIHGFLGNGLEFWILDLKDELLKRYDCNVISVDWEAGSVWFLPGYAIAAHSTTGVGNETHLLIKALQQYKGLLLENVHFIGHSLGAHVAGYASKYFQGRIGRISGLDPAGPEFRGLDKYNRLDKSDAIFVDILHTNACFSWDFLDCYGLDEEIGHVDFWPNGGAEQPYCSFWLGGEIGCNHEMAYRYYIESFRYFPNTTYFLARPCSSWDEFAAGDCACGKKQQFMGINVVPGADGSHYLRTGSSVPFAYTDDECAVEFTMNRIVFIVAALAIAVAALWIILLASLSQRFRKWLYHFFCLDVGDEEREPLVPKI